MPEVLIVDDDPDIRAMLAFTLGDDGFEVREAADGAEALDALAERAPDVMVLDLMMPRVDGFGVLQGRKDRGLAADTRVLILSCKVEQRDFVRGYELGADDYLTKPFDPDTLGQRLHGLLAASSEALRERWAAGLADAGIAVHR